MIRHRPATVYVPGYSDLIDEFMAGTNETGEVGELGWGFTNFTITVPSQVANHPGLIAVTTTAVINTIGRISLSNANACFKPSEDFDLTFIFTLNQTTLQEVRCGLAEVVSQAPPDDGIFWEHDTSDGADPTKWVAVTRDAGASTRTVSANVAASATYIKCRIVGTGGTSVAFYFNDALVGTHTTNIPTEDMVVFFQIETLEALTAKAATIDYFRLLLPGLVR